MLFRMKVCRVCSAIIDLQNTAGRNIVLRQKCQAVKFKTHIHVKTILLIQLLNVMVDSMLIMC